LALTYACPSACPTFTRIPDNQSKNSKAAMTSASTKAISSKISDLDVSIHLDEKDKSGQT
jgi:hypothetical protein